MGTRPQRAGTRALQLLTQPPSQASRVSRVCGPGAIWPWPWLALQDFGSPQEPWQPGRNISSCLCIPFKVHIFCGQPSILCGPSPRAVPGPRDSASGTLIVQALCTLCSPLSSVQGNSGLHLLPPGGFPSPVPIPCAACLTSLQGDWERGLPWTWGGGVTRPLLGRHPSQTKAPAKAARREPRVCSPRPGVRSPASVSQTAQASPGRWANPAVPRPCLSFPLRKLGKEGVGRGGLQGP